MKKEINFVKLNDLISLFHKILQVLFLLLIVLGIYVVIILLKEIQVLPFIVTVLKILSPLFIGLFIAWLFDPIVDYLHEKGIRRGLGSAICYVVFIGIIILVFNALIPLLSEQINEFVTNTLPSVFSEVETFVNNVFDKFNNVHSFDVAAMKLEVFNKLETFTTNITSSLPEILVNVIKASFSGLGVFMIGLLIGFYLLLDFDKNAKNLYSLLPVRYRKETKELLDRVNLPLRRFINGALLDMLLVFVVSAIGFPMIGLKAPLLFALFCAITNVIPYAGPYIGGAPAVVVGLTQGLPIGISVLLFIVAVQTIDGNFTQPLIMSKTTRLSPVTIILGLLLFGHFFGIVGMVASTPILGILKEIINYYDSKYEFLNFKD